MLVFVGSYTQEINIFSLDNAGILSYISTYEHPSLESPSWLSYSKTNKVLYAVSETEEGSVSAYRIDSATLNYLDTVSINGSAPCHSLVNETLIVSNYGSGTLAVVALKSDGGLGELVQTFNHNIPNVNAHVHEAVIDSGNCFVVDLGLNEIVHYNIDAKQGTLQVSSSNPKFQLPDATGPRHFVIHPVFDLAFLVNEEGNSVSSLKYDRGTGVLTLLSSITTLRAYESSEKMAAAELQLSQDGKIVYVSNRDLSQTPYLERDSIAVFSINPSSGQLTIIQHVYSLGCHPRHFVLHPNSGFLLVANKNSNNTVVFKVDSETGLLDPAGLVYQDHMGLPTQILIVPN
jgi:6-phosphogluconolactonase